MATRSRSNRPAIVNVISTVALATFGALALVWMSIVPAQANRSNATASFQGRATVEGENVPVGTAVSAYVRGVKVDETSTFDIDGNSVYSIDIGTDDENTDVIEGARDSDLIVFRIGEHGAEESAIWRDGTVQTVNIDGKLRDEPVTIATRSP